MLWFFALHVYVCVVYVSLCMWLETAVRGQCGCLPPLLFDLIVLGRGLLNLEFTNSPRLLVSKLLGPLVSYPALRFQRCAIVPAFLHRYWGSELSSRYLVGKSCTD